MASEDKRTLLRGPGLSLLIATLLLGGCSLIEGEGFYTREKVEGNGNIVTEKRSLPSFHTLRNEAPVDIRLVKNKAEVHVRSDSNLLSLIGTEVRNGVLKVHLEEPVKNTEVRKVLVPSKNLGKIENDGAGDIAGKKRFRWGIMKIQDEGAGDIKLHLSAEELHYKGEGSGDAMFRGNVKQLTIDNDGSGDVLALNLMAEKVYCGSEGSGDVKVDATVDLKVESEGSGDVVYKNPPPNIEVHSEGSGDVRVWEKKEKKEK
ncbi:MAG: head GIN domain-containing protein [Flavobacteriales bacterium]